MNQDIIGEDLMILTNRSILFLLIIIKTLKKIQEGNPIKSSLFIGKQRLTDYGKSNILGIQAQLFSENVRNTSILEYLLFPKLLALAERNWAQNPSWATEQI